MNEFPNQIYKATACLLPSFLSWWPGPQLPFACMSLQEASSECIHLPKANVRHGCSNLCPLEQGVGPAILRGGHGALKAVWGVLCAPSPRGGSYLLSTHYRHHSSHLPLLTSALSKRKGRHPHVSEALFFPHAWFSTRPCLLDS